MLRHAALGLLALTALPTAHAQDDAPDLRNPPLFVMSDDDSRVYLLGSIHVLPEGVLPMPPAHEAAYEEAAIVAFEVDADSVDAIAPLAFQFGMDEAGVADVLSAAQKEAFDAYGEALGVPAGSFDAMEPWLASLVLTMGSLEQAGLTSTGVDEYFETRARADGKERLELESARSQITMLDDLPIADQVKLLDSSLAGGPDSTAAQTRFMIDLWLAGDDAALERLTERSMPTGRFVEVALTLRNAAWVPQIEALLARENETALVVVGAAHLLGETSVVAMLREAGYEVTRL